MDRERPRAVKIAETDGHIPEALLRLRPAAAVWVLGESFGGDRGPKGGVRPNGVQGEVSGTLTEGIGPVGGAARQEWTPRGKGMTTGHGEGS